MLQDYRLLMWLSYQLGDYPAMLEYAQKRSTELKKNPENKVYGRDELAIAYGKNGKKALSSKMIDDVRRDFPSTLAEDRARVAYTDAAVRFESGDYSGALEQFHEAFRFVHPNHCPSYLYAVCLMKEGRFAEAVVEFQRLTVWSPIVNRYFDLDFLPGLMFSPTASVKAHYWLGVGYEQQGDKDKAAKEFERFLEIWKAVDFKSPEIDDAKSRLHRLKAAG